MSYRKRLPAPSGDNRPVSSRLRKANRLLTEGETAAALSELDAVIQGDRSPEVRSQVAALAAKSEAERGRFEGAATAYQRAVDLAPESGDTWLSPALGNVRVLLKAVEVGKATEAAEATLATALARWRDYRSGSSRATSAVRGGGNFLVQVRSSRPSVVASRLGQQFWEEGEADTAARYFGEAVRLEPGGAERARICLARIALINEDFQRAVDLAREALMVGKFRSKTLSAWPIIIAGARGLGIVNLNKPLTRGLAQAKPTVRGRAKLVIARALRDLGDPEWISYTELGPREDPRYVIEAEFAKLRLASAVQSGDSARKLTQLARQLADVPNIAPREWLSAAKLVISSRLAENKNPGIYRILSDGTATYGPSKQRELALGLAGACVGANQPALAIPILQRIVDADERDETWSRAASNLAKLFQKNGELGLAVPLLDRIARTPTVPERFQLYARLDWLRAVVASGNSAALAGARDEILNVARRLDDFELLLDLARQMTLAPPEIAAVADEIFDRGEQLARRAFQAEDLPEEALLIGFKLFRRQSDLGRFAAITEAWESLPDRKKLWLWSPQTAFWEMLALVAAAYRSQSRDSEATRLVETSLADPATPPEGLAILGVPESLAMIRRDDLAAALSTLAWIKEQAPTHEMAAYAYYWQCLRLWTTDRTSALVAADGIPRCVGVAPALGWKKRLTKRHFCLTRQLDPRALNLEPGVYPDDPAVSELPRILSDLNRFS